MEGRAALVTGASSGPGRAPAIALARAGVDVALAARSQQELDGAKEEISKIGRRALALPVDLAYFRSRKYYLSMNPETP